MKLVSITANSHVVGGRRTGTPLRLLLSFDDGSRLRLGAAGDGETMAIDRLDLDAPSDMKDFGSVVVEDVTALVAPGLEGADVAGIRTILLAGGVIGARVDLAGGDTLFLWVDGDELWWGDSEAFATHIWPNDRAPTFGDPIDG